MTYIPNPDDATEPTDATPAESAQAEFRALKAKVNNLQAATGTKVTRQTVLDGPTLAGLPSCIAVSAVALGIDINGAATAIYLAFAMGFSGGGNNDFVQVIATNQANYWGALAVLNTTYLSLDQNAAGNPTPLKTLAPPQYNFLYDPSHASILQFAGANGSTVFLDDFGNTWTQQGAAKVQNTQFKFGTGGLGGGGGGNTLDGVADFVKSAASFGAKFWSTGWFMRGWVYITTLPTAGNLAEIDSFVNAGGFGAELFCYNNAGTIHFGYNLSSNGAANDIASLAVGTTVPALNTWYYVELTFDKLAGEYRLYVNGAQEQHTTSAVALCGTTLASVGAKATGANFLKGYIDKFEMGNYCQHPGAVAYAVPTAAPSISAAGYCSDFFSLFDYVMYSVTAASTAAGLNPTLTPVTRLYIGEADTSALAVLAVRPYAYQGIYEGGYTAIPAASVAVQQAHNIGTGRIKNKRVQFQCLTADSGYTPGELIEADMNSSGVSQRPSIWSDRLNIGFRWGNSSTNPRAESNVDGSIVNFTAANWQYKLSCERGF